MKQRTAILLALACTAFVLVVVGAIAFSITLKNAAPEIVQSAPEPVQVENLGGGVGVQIKAPVMLPTNAPLSTVAAPSTAQPKLVSADRAARIALAVVPGGKLQQPPELVNYKGKMAYEVLLSGGTVYIDAFTGKVLANIIAVASNPAPQENSPATDNGGGNDNSGNGNEPASAIADMPSSPTTSDEPTVAQQDDDNNDNRNDDHDDADDHGNDDRDDGGDDHDGKDQKHKDNQDHKDDHSDDEHDDD